MHQVESGKPSLLSFPLSTMKTALAIVLASLLATRALVAEPIRFASAEATCHSGSEADFAKVIDGVETGPHGWSPAPKVSEPQALIVRSAKPVQAAELGFYLYFQAGRPWNAPAESASSFTTDATPSLQGNWQPMNILFFSSDLRTLRMTESGHMRLDFFTMEATGNTLHDTYRVRAVYLARCPGHRVPPGRVSRAVAGHGGHGHGPELVATPRFHSHRVPRRGAYAGNHQHRPAPIRFRQPSALRPPKRKTPVRVESHRRIAR